MFNSNNYERPSYSDEEHVHEFLGSTKLAGEGERCHNHRFAGVTGEAIPIMGGNHTHKLFTNTDFSKKHYHELPAETGPAIPVGQGRHVHFVRTRTTFDAGHFHLAIFATLIEDPLS
ncbi:MAG: YmaF family protein [Clostridiaceae bacterium]|nr:YmaF family protein [Clostridiaceae bacterium]MBW4860354.1 YmaF family protein [Clostridiaceae bacterium]MBW4867199.1 YmaF family protein [Clostridiaceae bacterium]